MRRLFAFSAIFLSLSVSAQKANNDCIIIAYNSDSSRCGYQTQVGELAIPVNYVFCYQDTICSFGSVVSPEGKAYAFNQKGEFLYEVYYIDNGPDYISDGMLRIVEDGRMGFANAAGEVVIKPQFDCAFAFEDGKAQVSYNCQRKKVDEYTMWESDDWFYIDKSGKKVEGP